MTLVAVKLAATAFLDDNACVICDPEHSDDEEQIVPPDLSSSCGRWSSVIGIASTAMSSASSNITGGCDEETLRLFQIC